MNTDFDGTPFVAGSVTAIRAFKVDSLGRLRSPQQKAIFTPGVNEAECGEAAKLHAALDSYRASYHYAQRLHTLDTSRLTTSYHVSGQEKPVREDVDVEAAVAADRRVRKAEEDIKKAEEAAEHVPGQMGCKCGFYAYYDETERNTWMDDGCVEAVVEATGTVTHGEKGIRAQKLRIVGMVDPKPKKPGLWRRLAGWMYDRIWAQMLVTAMAAAGGVGAILNLATDRYGLAFTLIASIVALLGAIGFSTAFVDVPLPRGAVELGDSAATGFELVKRNYPDVKVYRTRKAMLAAHPTTKPAPPAVPSPETDDNFWKREAP